MPRYAFGSISQQSKTLGQWGFEVNDAVSTKKERGIKCFGSIEEEELPMWKIQRIIKTQPRINGSQENVGTNMKWLNKNNHV